MVGILVRYGCFTKAEGSGSSSEYLGLLPGNPGVRLGVPCSPFGKATLHLHILSLSSSLSVERERELPSPLTRRGPLVLVTCAVFLSNSLTPWPPILLPLFHLPPAHPFCVPHAPHHWAASSLPCWAISFNPFITGPCIPFMGPYVQTPSHCTAPDWTCSGTTNTTCNVY